MTQLIHTASGMVLTSEEQARTHYAGVTAAANGGYGTTLDPGTINIPTEIDGVEDGNELLATLLETGLYAVHVPPDPVEPTTGDRQAQVWEQIKRHRDMLEDGGVFVDGKWWHTDIKSRAKYLGLTLMGAAVDGIQWKTMDGTMQALSQALVAQVFQGVAIADTTNFATAEAHRLAMVAASSLPAEDVGYIAPEAYDYSTGWTGSYQA